MIDKFFSLFQNNAIHKITLVAGICSQVMRTFEQEFEQDTNSKDACIDTLIELLQRHKTSSPAQDPAVPAASVPVPNSIPVA